ncbi:hypothetical protein J7438_19950 [Thalassotalea sp. G20_0]|uniref:hypothetical protein n=1 Tax=Thalassotalea sp. G20_0 TaxID=2821093 RepID=UPI001ADCF208|nr:hypothetical protein [Thalassotalea sp. G20_0]MBO9496333.1 hypothetical protein [Thalassotalea sp. G20_0]
MGRQVSGLLRKIDNLPRFQLVDFVGLDQREKYWGAIEIKLYRNDVRLHAGAERFWSALGKRCQQGWSLT